MSDMLSSERLLEEVAAETGLDDYGDVPFRPALDALLHSMRTQAKLDPQRSQTVHGLVRGHLAKRLRLVADRKRYPQIAAESIRAPIFITGLPRTGSTHLHALMALADGVRAPMYWEMAMPSPPPGAATRVPDPRIAEVQRMVEQFPLEALKRHPMAADRPEQCIFLFDTSFLNIALAGQYEIPSYRDWVLNADLAPAYEVHRRTLQHLQWGRTAQWVLKYPKHLMGIDALLAVYPDARFVWTHRDPATALMSAASLIGYWRSFTPGFDPQALGPEWTSLEELALLRGLAARDRTENASQRFLDVQYRDLLQDPAGTVGRIYRHFGMDNAAEARSRIEQWQRQHPQTKFGVHRYRAEDYGLDAKRLRERFAFYTKRFDVPAESPA